MIELGRRFNLNQQTRMFQYTSPAFDPSILEVFGTLIHGGCVCIPTETQRLNDIPGAINEMRVNTAVFVPSVLKLLHPEQIPTAEKLIIGGEALPQALVDLWAPRVQLINAYGPTETCVCSVANLRVGPGKYRGSIGTPIACRAWVVDPWNPRRLMHIGAVGELWIQGPIVARGYLRDEAATRTSFFASPMPWSDSGSPANGYRTGDLVRQLPDGALAFLGRKDKQIKLDGHRIEPEEVEAVIRLTGLVSNASVQLITTTDSSSPTLAAFVVPAGVECSNDDRCELSRRIESNSSVTSRLGEILKAQLPARMIPQYMIAVTCIPRLTSGKVDQRHLTKLFEDEIQDGHHHTACRSRFECNSAHHENSERHAAMRDLWSQALEVPPHHICANARFLHLGGNSIKAMKLVAAARSSGLVLTVSDVLGKSYTLDEMARTMKPVEPVSATPAMVVIQAPRQRRSTYAPTWIQAVSVTTVGAFPEGNYTRIVVDLRGPLDLARLYKAFQCLVARNEILRTQYSLKDGGIEATVLDASEISTPLVPLASLSDAVQHWESAPATSCFDRQLVDFTYVTLSESSARFALGLQHSQYDAWTVPLLLRQLQSLYQQPGSDELASLRPPGPPFSEYATRLARESHNPEAERFWKKLLEGVSMTILSNKETDGVTGDVDADEPDGHFHHSFRLPTSRFTPATIVYTAWALVLAQHTQKTTKTSKVIFGGAVSGRNIDMDGILDVVGPCINMIPFAVDAFGGSSRRNRTYLAALQTVQEAMLATVPYEAMPMPEIIARCTNWDPAGVFGSIVQHLDISFDIPLLAPSSTLEWKFVETRKHYGRCRATDIYIFSSTGTEGGKRTMEVQFKFNPSRVAPLLAQVLFDDLCGHIEAMGRDPAKKISIGL
ncbi:hypothetical protein BJY04DRAFT_230650 [Aspergillus karnatakaensis]|uniref:uncharacterized protein n=1 Tax=Aspergillus karnatakaensis TaxID=1810916 RepID=UPI003CCE252E